MPFGRTKEQIYAHATRVLFLFVCGCLVGGGLSGWLFGTAKAQTSVYERLANQEQQIGAQGAQLTVQKYENEVFEREIAELKAKDVIKDVEISDLQKEIATQHGIGIAAGSILGILMFFNMFFTRRGQSRSKGSEGD